MRVLRLIPVWLTVLAASLPVRAQEEAPPAAEEPARPTAVAVIASGSAEVTAEALDQARAAAVDAVAAERERHGRVVRPEADPGLTARAAACEDDECFVAVARDAQVRFLLLVLLSRAESGYQAPVVLVDADAGQTVGSAMLRLPPDPASFAGAMPEPLGPLLAAIPPVGPTTGRLVVTADQVGAAVFVDGERVGSTPLAPIEDLEAGEHRVRVAFEGFEDFLTTVEVPAGGEVAVEAALEPQVAEAPVEETPFWRQWWFWTIIGGAVVVTGAAVGLGVGLSDAGETNQAWGVPFPDYEPR